MANGNPTTLPGADVLAVVMAAPTDILSLITKQSTDAMNVLNAGVQRFGVAVAKPPALPTPAAFSAGFPPFPPFPGMSAGAGEPTRTREPAPPAPAAKTTVYGGVQAMPLYRVTVQT